MTNKVELFQVLVNNESLGIFNAQSKEDALYAAARFIGYKNFHEMKSYSGVKEYTVYDKKEILTRINNQLSSIVNNHPVHIGCGGKSSKDRLDRPVCFKCDKLVNPRDVIYPRDTDYVKDVRALFDLFNAWELVK